MSNFTVLPKILKLRLINQQLISNIRHITNGRILGSEQLNLIRNANTNRNVAFDVSQSNRRLVHACQSLWKNSGDDSTKKVNIDQFRAEETKIEHEYEELERKKQEKQSQHDQSGSESAEDHEKIQKLRADILESSLKFVAADGWSNDAISHGAEALNYPGIVHGMFPNGAIELIHHFYAKCNRELIEQLQRELSESEKGDANGKPIDRPSPRDFAIRAIRLRLEMIVPYKDTWPQAMAIMTLPQNVPTSLAQLLTLVDDICYCAGDRSVDIGWYTRRVGIASIYKMVELYLLQDKSADHQQTWEFLERRMDEGLQIQEFLSTSDQKAQTMGRALGSAFQTARNILGINCDKR